MNSKKLMTFAMTTILTLSTVLVLTALPRWLDAADRLRPIPQCRGRDCARTRDGAEFDLSRANATKQRRENRTDSQYLQDHFSARIGSPRR